jgi:hypothetical protein
MSPQYQILSELLDALRTSALCYGRHNRVECLIYRLKLLLLTCESYGHLALDNHCPTSSLREMKRLITVVDSAETARAALTWVDDELQRLIHLLETTRLALEAQGSQIGLTPHTVDKLSPKSAQNQLV